MNRFIHLLFLSLAVLATGSVSFAVPPPAVYELPTIKKEMAPLAMFVATPVVYTVDHYDGPPIKVSLTMAMHGMYYILPTYQAHNTPYVFHYPFRHQSRANYWPGPSRYGNA